MLYRQFNSSSYFAKCFKTKFGVLPKDFGNKPADYYTQRKLLINKLMNVNKLHLLDRICTLLAPYQYGPDAKLRL